MSADIGSMEGIELIIHGAALTVTGSCFEIKHRGKRLLVDCGLFQGSRTLERLNREPFGFKPGEVDCVLLTHAHIDHSGLLPRLVAEGFDGPIWCTAATGDLLEYMLCDAARIQEGEAARRNRRADRADEPHIDPLYTEEDARQAIGQIHRTALGEWFEPLPSLKARLWNAGHILGSASIELRSDDVSILFSGDLGPVHKTFHPDPQAPSGIDHVICESTYGDRERVELDATQRRELLKQEVTEALAAGGNLVIPVFAVERTQELLFDLASLIASGDLRHPSVFIDSPLATRATSVFARHSQELEDIAGRDIFRNPAFHYVEDTAESIRLNTISGAIILAASGMCEAGRIRHHLVHNLARRDSTILFVGFQAEGTLGRAIVDGAKRVRISGRDFAVKARIRRIESYSAHADRNGLIKWIEARRPIRGSLFLDHGEEGAIRALRDAVARKDADILVPEIGERYLLLSGQPARRLATGRMEARHLVGRDWQNEYADFAVNLKRELQHIHDEASRREAIERMRRVLQDYKGYRDKKQAGSA